jgi:hypothetical protein
MLGSKETSIYDESVDTFNNCLKQQQNYQAISLSIHSPLTVHAKLLLINQ